MSRDGLKEMLRFVRHLEIVDHTLFEFTIGDVVHVEKDCHTLLANKSLIDDSRFHHVTEDFAMLMTFDR